MRQLLYVKMFIKTDLIPPENDLVKGRNMSSVDSGGPSGYPTLLWIRGSRVRSRPGSIDFFFSERKNPEYSSFGKEVKPWVQCRRFTARKRT